MRSLEELEGGGVLFFQADRLNVLEFQKNVVYLHAIRDHRLGGAPNGTQLDNYIKHIHYEISSIQFALTCQNAGFEPCGRSQKQHGDS